MTSSLAAWYPELRALHIGSVLVSIALFVLRGIWREWRPQLLERRWVRVLPHAVDTVLLASALALAAVIGQYPFTHGWLTAKVVALAAYIVLGSFALKRARTPAARRGAFIAALATVAYIVWVARAHDPCPPG